jgi:hypothetical protein
MEKGIKTIKLGQNFLYFRESQQLRGYSWRFDVEYNIDVVGDTILHVQREMASIEHAQNRDRW